MEYYFNHNLNQVQTFSMFLALILVAIKGTIDLKEGGFSYIIDSALESSRLEAPM
jgi:hypothetical protein